jgi:hypothetical protein
MIVSGKARRTLGWALVAGRLRAWLPGKRPVRRVATATREK